jgi:Ca-activated chloride channel family protein
MPYTASPLTLDHAWLIERVKSLEFGMAGDGTAIGTALASAVNRLRDSEARSKVVVLLTDGMNNAGSIAPDDAGKLAQAMDIKVYTIGAAGMEPFSLVPMRSPFGGTQMVRQPNEIDEAMLKRISESTGALYFRATDLRGLEDVYRRIDAMEKTEMDVTQYTRFEERFAVWVAAGMALLALEKALSLTRLGRHPA